MSKEKIAATIRCYRPEDEAALIALWQECGLIVPWNNPHSDIARKMEDSPQLFFVAEAAGDLLASCMAGYDGHRGWIYYLAVAPACQRQGLASKLLAHAESALRALACAKVELMVRASNQQVLAFYQQNAYQQEPVVVLSKRLIDDDTHEYG